MIEERISHRTDCPGVKYLRLTKNRMSSVKAIAPNRVNITAVWLITNSPFLKHPQELRLLFLEGIEDF